MYYSVQIFRRETRSVMVEIDAEDYLDAREAAIAMLESETLQKLFVDVPPTEVEEFLGDFDLIRVDPILDQTPPPTAAPTITQQEPAPDEDSVQLHLQSKKGKR